MGFGKSTSSTSSPTHASTADRRPRISSGSCSVSICKRRKAPGSLVKSAKWRGGSGMSSQSSASWTTFRCYPWWLPRRSLLQRVREDDHLEPGSSRERPFALVHLDRRSRAPCVVAHAGGLARYYGVALPPAFTPGYDLVDKR